MLPKTGMIAEIWPLAVFFQHINASAKYFIFKGLQNSSLPEGPKCDTFHGIHKALEIFLFSAKRYALLGTLKNTCFLS